MSAGAERADAIVVGARCAGSAAAIALARAGRRVIAVDRASFPSDTLSTHLMFPGAVVELAALGALGRVEAIGAPRMPVAQMEGVGLSISARYTPVDGIDYALCVRRTGLDAALVATAREAGAEVRERARVTELVWEGRAVAGVRYADADGAVHEVHAPLVVGADGRRSTVARQVGAERPYRSNANERGCYFAYFSDPDPERRGIAAQWREAEDLGTAFPCDDGLLLVLLMPSLARAGAFRDDLAGEYERTIKRIPGLRDRLAGARRTSKVRSATDTTSYFRRSAGPGWALPGDAGHFKDPVTAQGIRDALRYGRLLGGTVAPVLDDPPALARSLAEWERVREDDCLEMYQWTNQLARAEPVTPLETELYRRAAGDPQLARQFADVFARSSRPSDVFSIGLGAALTVKALARPGIDRRATLRWIARDVRAAAADRRERARAVADASI